MAQFLIANGADVNVGDNRGCSPLHWAATAGRVEVAQFLITSGSKVDARDANGATPMHEAASGDLNPSTDLLYKALPKVVRLLFSNGAEANARDANGPSPLHQAPWAGHIEVALALLAAGLIFTLRTIWVILSTLQSWEIIVQK